MADNRTPENVELGDFLELAGKSLAEAQSELLSGLNINSNMVLNNADIEVKVTVGSENGKIVVKPISAEEIRIGSIDPGLLSTLKISYVSTMEEPIQESEPEVASPSFKNPTQMIEEVMKRKDIQKLVNTKGDVDVKPVFVPERSRWLVSVEDKSGKVLRELVLPDK